jgi:two-component sensor histidine kinase
MMPFAAVTIWQSLSRSTSGTDAAYKFASADAPDQKNQPVIAVFDRSGTIVAASNMEVARTIFTSAGKLKPTVPGAFNLKTETGQTWTIAFAARPTPRSFDIAYALPFRQVLDGPLRDIIISILVPLLMIAAALLAWNLAAKIFISRWIGTLIIMASAKDAPANSSPDDPFRSAPSEFRELSTALAHMTTDIAVRTQSLNVAITQKDSLIREIHHRVKNSIQIVMSLLALQSHQLNDPAARKAIELTRARVAALALAERKVGERDATGAIDPKPLVEETISQAHHHFDGMCTALSTSQDLSPCVVSTSSAVPLAMFVNEVLICACERNSLAPQQPVHVKLTLHPSAAESARLVMTTSVADGSMALDLPDDAMSLRLLKALAMQLTGTLDVSHHPDGATAVTLDFPVMGSTLQPA